MSCTPTPKGMVMHIQAWGKHTAVRCQTSMTTQRTQTGVKVTSMDKAASGRIRCCRGMDKPVATLSCQQCISHWWPLSTTTRTRHFLEVNGFYWINSEVAITGRHIPYISGERERRRPATTAASNRGQLSTCCISAQSHSSLAAWCSYINYKTKKPLIGYQDGARHTKSK